MAPQSRRESKRSEQRGTWKPDDLNLFLEHLLETHDFIDPDRVYLTGNSMGGYGCWVWGGHSPKHFAAIAPIVGGIGRGGPKDGTPNIDKWAANLIPTLVQEYAKAEFESPKRSAVTLVDGLRAKPPDSFLLQISTFQSDSASQAMCESISLLY